MEPSRPRHTPEYAELCLEVLAQRDLGDRISIGGAFSFQIAKRSARLRPSRPAPWQGMLLDSFQDLVANKMVALVERGAPRDFRDIYSLCKAGMTTAGDSWRLWRERQKAAGADTGRDRARLAVETHLARIVQYRPLEKIADPQEREAAADARAWYRKELLDALMD